MLIDHKRLLNHTREAIPTPDRHSVTDRIRPSIFQYDYLALKFLYQDIESLLTLVDRKYQADDLAVDIGSDKSPYSALLNQAGYQVKTLDLTTEFGSDLSGTAEKTNLPDNSVDLIICTQVLEHTHSPWKAMQEFNRILKPDGYLLFSVPHAWFYHPHPSDYWRMTQEGVVTLCEDSDFKIVELRAQGGSISGMCQVVNFVLFGGVKKFGGVVFAFLNILAPLADMAFQNSLFSLNFACLARPKSYD
jgi:SAM-dependent methyltransferase